jgi:hypothetical protein
VPGDTMLVLHGSSAWEYQRKRAVICMNVITWVCHRPQLAISRQCGWRSMQNCRRHRARQFSLWD